MSSRSEPPIGILITIGKEVIVANGGLLSFIRHFEKCLKEEDRDFWLHKSRNGPKQDIATVYVIICNQVRYKLFYGGHETGERNVWKANGDCRLISWPRIVLAGPFEKAPGKIPMRGFQGFRYVYEPIF